MSLFEFNGSFTYLPDPQEYRPMPLEEAGRMGSGQPVPQGYEEGDCYWEVLSQQQYGELMTRYEASKNSSQTAKIPPRTGAAMGTYRTVTCYGHEPQAERQDGPLVYGVTMHLSKVQ